MPNQNIFPFVEVIPNGTNVENTTTCGGINSEYNITVKIKDTRKHNIADNTNVEIVDGLRTVVLRMEERDSSGNTKADTILGILKNNLKLDENVNISDNWNISYDETQYGESWIMVASINFTCNNLTT